MERRLRLVGQEATTQTQQILPQQSARIDVCAIGWNGFIDYQNPAGVRLEDCARCLVWTMIFEAGLVIVMLLC
jgi:hypothetical protein